MKRFSTHGSLAVLVILAGSVAWAQDSGLPALPPGMEGSTAVPEVQLPPPPVVEEPAPAAVDPMPGPGIVNVPPVRDDAQQTPPVQTTQTQTPPEQVPANVPVAQAEAPNDAPKTQEPANALKKDFKPSYGEFSQSLFYTPEDIERMKKVLYMYEQVQRPEGTVAVVKDEFTELLDDVKPIESIQEPSKYPSFYLSSVVYRSSRDWLFWMNGEKYSPKKLPDDMKVVAVSPRSVTFSWTPQYVSQAKMRYEMKRTDNSLPRHFKASGGNVRYDKETESFIFTVAPNQSFVSAAFAIYEGKHGDRGVPVMAQQVQLDNIIPDNAPIEPFRDPDAELKSTMRQLQRVNSNLNTLTPRSRTTNNPATPPSTTPTN